MPAQDSTDHSEDLELLRHSDLVIVGKLRWSSNATFLCELWPQGTRPDAGLKGDGNEEENEVESDGKRDGDSNDEPLGRAIYKPHRGEQPLWDFPDGLYRREVAAFELAQAIGWDLIPPTVERDGPFGIGSVQLFIDADFSQHYFELRDRAELHDQLKRLCAFDFVANSTDRKGGHVLMDDDGHIWGIDNGLCLHSEFKLRTVIWDFAHEPLDISLVEDLERFVEKPLPPYLEKLLNPLERDGLSARVQALIAGGHFPNDPSGRRVPWPLV